MLGKILCVRVKYEEMPDEVRIQLIDAFGDRLDSDLDDLEFKYVNPQTPEELDAMAQADDVVAVYLQERPLPTIVLEKGETPCVLMSPGGSLVQLKEVKPVFTPFVP